MPVLLVAAEPREFGGLLRFCRNVRPLEWPVHWARSAEWNGNEMLLVANGAGSARAAQAVEASRPSGRFDRVCSIGFCGALEEGMQIGDVFVADRIRACGREYVAARPATDRAYRSGVLASIAKRG